MLIAGATPTSHVANDFAEDEQNFVKLTEGMTEVSNNKLKLMKIISRNFINFIIQKKFTLLIMKTTTGQFVLVCLILSFTLKHPKNFIGIS